MSKKNNELSRLRSLMRQTEHWLGRNNERRVLDALTEEILRAGSIPWIANVRLAMPEEDARGIDVIFDTDVGKIYVQVKSSKKARSEFIERQHNGDVSRRIIPLRVSVAFNSRRICQILIPQVSAERNRRLWAAKMARSRR